MSELTITLLRLGLLALLWVFVFAVVGVLRGDLYGTRLVTRQTTRAAARDRAANAAAAVAAAGGAAAARAAAPATPGAPQRGRGNRAPTHLVVTEGPLSGMSIPLRESGTLIGRNPECALVLDDDYASGRHLKIYRGDVGWVAEDLGSTNGTYLGGRRLTEVAPVTVGSQLRIGKTVVELQR
jgi:hypothetical protein